MVRRRGKKTEALFGLVAAWLIVAELVLIPHPPWPSLPPWCVVSVAGSATTLTSAIVGIISHLLVARANGRSGRPVIWQSFVQYGTGLILEQWPRALPMIAYRIASLQTPVLQLVALPRFANSWPAGRERKVGFGRTPNGAWLELV
ncbi:hypothetical protein ABIC09_005839 [Bradyrhizobium sp. S3.12.5]|uniref:hypothetical protein n=1 Tax=Bradyrhizobium sp. S3.12.5 TaxID=3156386 RepID=UPI003394ECCF